MATVCARSRLIALLTCSITAALSFLSPEIRSFPSLGQAPRPRIIMQRQAATALPGNVPRGSLERGVAKQSATIIVADNVEVPPNTTQGKVLTARKTAKPPSNDASPELAATVGQAAKASVKPEAASGQRANGVPPLKGAAAGAQVVERIDNPEARESVEPAVDAPPPAGKIMGGLTALPETAAAEKVITLLEMGLVKKEEMAAYYEALSELERTTRNAKAAQAAAEDAADATAASLKPPRSSTTPFTPQGGPLSLIPFPTACAALGAAGTQALHLTGPIGTALSLFGAFTGVALGSLVVIGDDAGGRAARAAGSALAQSAGTVGTAAGRGLSESLSGIAGAAAFAVEEAVVKAPANVVAGWARSVSNAVSVRVASVLSLPGQLAAKVAAEAKGGLQDTSEAATQAVRGALQTTLQASSDAASTAIRESPKQARKRLQEAVSAGKALAAPFSRAWSEGANKREKPQKIQQASHRESATDANGRAAEQEPKAVPAAELDAKLLSVHKALKRFDDVKTRIEQAHTSDILLETVSMARNMNASAERERSEKSRAAIESAKEVQMGSKEDTESRPSRHASRPTVAITKGKATGENRRQEVSKRLLEMASRREVEAKAGLKAAAASARQEADLARAASPVAAASTQTDPQAPVPSR